MDFSLSDEQRMIAENARKVGERFGLDYWRDRDSKKAFPAEFWQAVCEAGFCGVALPEEHGGSGLGMVEMALIIEQLAAAGGGATVGQLFMINPIFGGVSISRFGTDAMKRDLLPKIISGEINCCMALTEPDAGSNSLEIKTFATRSGNGWRLSGRKIWITGVESAAKMLVIARTRKLGESTSRTDGLSMFLLDVEREGLTHTPIDKLGTCTLDSSSVFFDNVRIEADELVGTLHKGWRELLDVLNEEGIGCIVFSPLAQGLLTDRYLTHNIPEGSRASKAHSFLKPAQVTDEKLAKVEKLNQIAGARGQSMAQLALAWVLRHPGMTSALIGASSVKQIEDNVATLNNLAFAQEELDAIEGILAG